MTELDLFTEALALPNEAECSAFLEKKCSDNPSLRKRIEQLIKQHRGENSLFEHQPAKLVYGTTLAAILPAEDKKNSLETRSIDPVEQIRPYLKETTHPGSFGLLGRCEILQVLGQGGFGIVFKGLDVSLDRIVAIKVLSPQLAQTSPPRKRFLREARSAAAVQHEHVVQIYDVQEEPIPYIVMEFVEGQTVQQLLDGRGPLEAVDVIRLGTQIAVGLAAAHGKGIVHRDIKPANILLASSTNNVKISDFGLARTSDDASLTQSGLLVGTPMYMSPEQARGEETDSRTDLFSFGSVLYSMSVGHPPFRESNTYAVLKRVVEDTPRPMAELIPEIPSGLQYIISKLHCKNLDERYQSATEVVADLSECLTKKFVNKEKRANKANSTKSQAKNGKGRLIKPFIAPLIGIAAAVLLLIAFAYIFIPAPGPNAKSTFAPVNEAKQLPVDRQIKAVRAKLKELNPEFDEASPAFELKDGKVFRVSFENTKNLFDLSALQGLPDLRELVLLSKSAESPSLKGIKGLKLSKFTSNCDSIRDFSALEELPLEEVSFNYQPKLHTKSLRKIKTLKTINNKPAESVFKDRTDFVYLDEQAWLAIALEFSGAELVEVVRDRLVLLNPQWNKKNVDIVVKNSIVTGVNFLKPENSVGVVDMSPIRACNKLELFIISNGNILDISTLKDIKLKMFYNHGVPTKDLSFLTGMQLEVLWNMNYEGDDISFLKGMPLKDLNINYSPKIADISALEGAPLKILNFSYTKVTDLKPLAQCKALEQLYFIGTKIDDISPLENLPIKVLNLGNTPIKNLDILKTMPLERLSFQNEQWKEQKKLIRSIKTLKFLNDKPIAEIIPNDE